MSSRNPTSTHLLSGVWVNKDFDPFEIGWIDRSEALKLFCYSAKKEFCPILENVFEIADYSVFKVDSILDVLVHNATTNDTSENGTRSFEAEYNTCHPSPRMVRYRLGGLNITEIEHALQEGNEKILSLAQNQRIFKNPLLVSIDITHTPCYGKRKKYACGTKEFKGTKYGYRYASVAVSMNGIRFTLYTVPMTQFTKKTEILETLIREARKYVKIRVLLVDRGFFNIPCIKNLEELHVTYLMPVIKHNKKFLQSLRPPCRREMPMGPEKNRIYFTVVAVRSPKDPKTILYYATNMDIPEKSLEDVIDIYKKRWTIENAFKSQKLAFLAKTYSVSFAIRFFFWVLATLLYNLWILCNLTVFRSLKLDPFVQKRPLITARLFGNVMEIMLLQPSLVRIATHHCVYCL